MFTGCAHLKQHLKRQRESSKMYMIFSWKFMWHRLKTLDMDQSFSLSVIAFFSSFRTLRSSFLMQMQCKPCAFFATLPQLFMDYTCRACQVPLPWLGRRFRRDQRLAIGTRSDRITIAHIPILVIQNEPTDWVICICNNIIRNITRLRGTHKPLRFICCAYVTSPRWYIENI